ncbi:MAG TPA: hypothetical protein VFY81_03200 [Gammaproteobacteria bacterium]|nr:hypothetical protein [Gammaproteobacteria bacterium]
MSLVAWTSLFLATSLFWKWVISWGGAEWLEGWKAFLVIDWFAAAVWSAEQIKLYALACWIGNGIWFAIGLFVPGLRFSW